MVAATVARGLFPATFTLYLFTIGASAGVALAQTSIPMLARQWFPDRIGFVSAIFTVGLTLGETIAASLTVPLMRAWFGPNAWPAALLVWAIPATLTLALWLWLAPPDPMTRGALDGAQSEARQAGAGPTFTRAGSGPVSARG